MSLQIASAVLWKDNYNCVMCFEPGDMGTVGDGRMHQLALYKTSLGAAQDDQGYLVCLDTVCKSVVVDFGN